MGVTDGSIFIFLLFCVGGLGIALLIGARVDRSRARDSSFPRSRTSIPPPPRKDEIPPAGGRAQAGSGVKIAVDVPEQCASQGGGTCPMLTRADADDGSLSIRYCQAFGERVAEQPETGTVERCAACKTATNGARKVIFTVPAFCRVYLAQRIPAPCPMLLHMKGERERAEVFYCRVFDAMPRYDKPSFRVVRCAACKAATVREEAEP